MKYDPDRKVAVGEWSAGKCPKCGGDLLVVKVETRPHPSGDGLAWDCPHCGVGLHENQHVYIFLDEPELVAAE